MKISEIDKDFVDIVKYLDEKGLKPYSSCDGVEANHIDKSQVTSAYIAFMKSPQIIDIMATFLRDKGSFTVTLLNNTYTEPHELYGNMIEGNSYIVNFTNRTGAMTSYFERIIKGVIEGRIVITDAEKQMLTELDDILEDDGKSDLSISVSFNREYSPYMKKDGQVNVLTISTKEGNINGIDTKPKEGYVYSRSMDSLMDMLSSEFGIIKKSNSLDESFKEDEFAVSLDDSTCDIYFKDEYIGQILE